MYRKFYIIDPPEQYWPSLTIEDENPVVMKQSVPIAVDPEDDEMMTLTIFVYPNKHYDFRIPGSMTFRELFTKFSKKSGMKWRRCRFSIDGVWLNDFDQTVDYLGDEDMIEARDCPFSCSSKDVFE